MQLDPSQKEQWNTKSHPFLSPVRREFESAESESHDHNPVWLSWNDTSHAAWAEISVFMSVSVHYPGWSSDRQGGRRNCKQMDLDHRTLDAIYLNCNLVVQSLCKLC